MLVYVFAAIHSRQRKRSRNTMCSAASLLAPSIVGIVEDRCPFGGRSDPPHVQNAKPALHPGPRVDTFGVMYVCKLMGGTFVPPFLCEYLYKQQYP